MYRFSADVCTMDFYSTCVVCMYDVYVYNDACGAHVYLCVMRVRVCWCAYVWTYGSALRYMYACTCMRHVAYICLYVVCRVYVCG